MLNWEEAMQTKYGAKLFIFVLLYLCFILLVFTNSAYSQDKFVLQNSLNFGVSNDLLYPNSSISTGLKPKSRSLAIMYAFAATAGLTAAPFLLKVNAPAPAFLIFPGIIVGPSVGNIYANNWKGALNGSLIRIGAGALFVAGGFSGGGGLAGVFIISAIGIAIYSVIYDIFFSSPRSVDEYNQRIREKSSISVHPWIHPGGNGGGLTFHLDL
jgi:hypothetical protein